MFCLNYYFKIAWLINAIARVLEKGKNLKELKKEEEEKRITWTVQLGESESSC